MIAFRGFRKRFGAHVAVVDLTLEIRRGETLALLGPNGSGKTTTLKAAAGLITPTAGEVLLGEPGRSASVASARDLVSYLPQRVSFPDALTGRDVVEFYRRLRGTPASRTDDVLRFASLNGAAGRAVGTYSGGMTQRLGLAVAVLPDAPVFLLDEPTAALDPDGLAAFYSIVERHAAEGRTVLFTSHQLGDVERLADRFAVLVAGRLVAVLTQRQLHDRLAQRGVMRVRAACPPGGALERLRAMAPDTHLEADEIVVPGPPSLRPAALDVLREAGVEIRGLTAEEGRLDAFYRELVGDSA
jgi:Cu-processing system ATP-binding protein